MYSTYLLCGTSRKPCQNWITLVAEETYPTGKFGFQIQTFPTEHQLRLIEFNFTMANRRSRDNHLTFLKMYNIAGTISIIHVIANTCMQKET